MHNFLKMSIHLVGHVRQIKLASSLVNFWAHGKIAFIDWLIEAIELKRTQTWRGTLYTVHCRHACARQILRCVTAVTQTLTIMFQIQYSLCVYIITHICVQLNEDAWNTESAALATHSRKPSTRLHLAIFSNCDATICRDRHGHIIVKCDERLAAGKADKERHGHTVCPPSRPLSDVQRQQWKHPHCSAVCAITTSVRCNSKQRYSVA